MISPYASTNLSISTMCAAMIDPANLPEAVLSGTVKLMVARALPIDEFAQLKAEVLGLIACEAPEHSENYGGVDQYTLFSTVDRMDVPTKVALLTPGQMKFHHADKYPRLATFIGRYPELMTCRIIGLKPGGGVPKHKDGNQVGSYVIGRFHLPILTNDAVEMSIGDELFPLKEGVSYLLNFGLEHWSLNKGATFRYHLIWDLPLLPHVCEQICAGGL